MILDELAIKHGTDKSSKVHDYCRHYEAHLKEMRSRSLDIYLNPERTALLEIGVLDGASLRMWSEWLPYTSITGIDVDPKTFNVETGNGVVIITDVKAFTTDMKFDAVIDDGSHLAGDVEWVLRHGWDWVKPGGWLIIEDWATQWLPEWGGEVGGSRAVTFAHQYLSAVLIGHPKGDVAEVHAYPEILFLRKR